jgi:pyridoxine 5'-phosphate synthase PdxJ
MTANSVWMKRKAISQLDTPADVVTMVSAIQRELNTAETGLQALEQELSDQVRIPNNERIHVSPFVSMQRKQVQMLITQSDGQARENAALR